MDPTRRILLKSTFEELDTLLQHSALFVENHFQSREDLYGKEWTMYYLWHVYQQPLYDKGKLIKYLYETKTYDSTAYVVRIFAAYFTNINKYKKNFPGYRILSQHYNQEEELIINIKGTRYRFPGITQTRL